MHHDPVVSVIIPVYNGARYIAESIESVLRQTVNEWELIVMNNCSTDDTGAIVRSYADSDARIRLIDADEHVDIHSNHNRSLRLIDNECRFVKILHADDWMYSECLAQMMQIAEQHPSAAFVSAYRLEGMKVQHDQFFPYSQSVMHGREALRKSIIGDSWVTGSPSSLLFRSEVIRAEREFFDPHVWHSDTDAAHRSMLKGDVAFVHQVLTFTRLHQEALTSFSRRVNSYRSDALRTCVRYGPKVLDPDTYRATVRDRLHRYIWFLMKQCLQPLGRNFEELQHFHMKEIDGMISDASTDLEVRYALTAAKQLVQKAAWLAAPISRRRS